MRPSLLYTVAFLLIVPAHSRGAAPLPVSVTVAGGVSLGAYEAGLAYYALEALRANPGVAQVKIATGASAGSVNGLLILLQSCGAPAPDPRQSLFWKAWIPLGLAQLTQSGKTEPTAAFSRASFEEPVEMIRTAWAQGLTTECDVVYGLSVTRLEPRQVPLKGERLQLPQVEEHFLVRIQGRGPGKSPRLTNYADPAWEGEQALLPEGKSGEVPLAALVDALFASTAFPGAFPPQAVRHCVVRGGSGTWPGCPEASARSDLFVDGGVFDNTPIRLSTVAVAAGLRLSDGRGRWLDRPDMALRNVPDEVVFTYVSTEIRSYPATGQDVAKKAPASILGMATQVGTSFFDSARAKNLITLHDDLPDFFEGLNLPERHLPAASSPLGAFFGFFEQGLREFDFTLGMYDARRMAEARMVARLARAGRPGALKAPESQPAAVAASSSWQPYHCLSAVLDDLPAAGAACRGEALRDFRIVLQTSLERLWDRCAKPSILETPFAEDPRCRAAAEGQPPIRVPGVGPLPGTTWHRGEKESEAAYTLRLLAAHGFEFVDLGLRRDQADEAPVRLRQRLLALGRQAARSQPGAEAAVVQSAFKVGADQLGYVPPRSTGWVLIGRDVEIGLSRGFGTARGLVAATRLHAALQINDTATLLSSEHGTFAIGAQAGVEVLPASLSSSALQLSLLVRGGVLLSAGDHFWTGSCPAPSSDQVGSCSRPVLGAGVSATALERVRLQLLFNWYFPVSKGEHSWWAISPGIGLQWGF
jgi:hypothetical protein